MFMVKEAVVSLLELHDSGFRKLSLVVEKGLLQVNLHDGWAVRQSAYQHAQLLATTMTDLFSDASLHLCVPDNSMMETSGNNYSENC